MAHCELNKLYNLAEIMNLEYFKNDNLHQAASQFFKTELKLKINAFTEKAFGVADYFKALSSPLFELIENIYVVGIVNNESFHNDENLSDFEEQKIDYQTIFVVALQLNKAPNRSQLAQLTRLVNKPANTQDKGNPVVAVFRYENKITLASLERQSRNPKDWHAGEKISNTKVSMLKDVEVDGTHTAHRKILSGLAIDNKNINSFEKLYSFWQKQLSIQALNDEFYADLQEWFYFATKKIELPFKPDYIDEKENIKNFIVRLLARTMFCWFVKEKGLIHQELLELKDWNGNPFLLTKDIENEDFLHSNSYYRGILQNLFFNALNQADKKSVKDFKWTKYWHPNLPIEWLTEVPYLNGGIFDKLEEDNAKESIEDSVIKIPNFLFYGIKEEQEVTRGRGARATTTIEKVEHKGLNGILKSYKFTLDENTPFEEDIALDPEMLGLVFENLLAELDPNLEESTIRSIRKQTGSYYTPRKVIFEMVNDSLNVYLSKYISENYPTITNTKSKVNDLVYYSILKEKDTAFEQAVVDALDKYKVLDPACGSGAFPMGMLHRIVDILKLVDDNNEKWVELKLNNVDKAQKAEFKKVLTSHLDDYGRKLGIIRDSIYGIDIQPLAVQITKLRFFISLLIDQKTNRGITPMPNIETKIICADSLKNIQADLFSKDAIERLIEARTRYYQPDITPKERQTIADEIIDVLDVAFPSFSFQITGKRIAGQNKELIRHWFTHGTIAAPFFNMDFFYPELTETGGFDCVIGNPPYGGVKISDDVRTALDIESKDPYGAFIARFLQRPTNENKNNTPLKHGGVLAYIVSDTFMTIKSHLKLRKHLVQNYVHKMLRVHPDTFRATVNTVIMVAERNTQKELDEKHICLMADLTNISIHDNYEHFVEVLNQTKGVDFDSTDAFQSVSNEEYAIYYYPQALIKTNSNLPFFVASPKLFALMNDSGKNLKKELKEIGGKKVQVRKIQINEKTVEVLKLGEIADVRKGIDTGDNHKFLYQNIDSRGNYNDVASFLKYILNEDELKEIANNEELKGIIKYKGFSLQPGDKNYFKGKYIIPYEKGGESDIESGWLPNYYVPNSYFIDWSEKSVKNLFSAQSNETNQATLRNQDYWFKLGLTFSLTGYYAPTIRLKSPSMFDNKSSGIFTSYDELISLGILSSKIQRFVMKTFLMHTIDTQVGVFDDSPFLINSINESAINTKVLEIIKKQKSNSRYDYASHEQIEIDKLVYEAYGLNAEDVQEVENWYARRYPKLSAAQKANLRALGKSDDYLELYGLK